MALQYKQHLLAVSQAGGQFQRMSERLSLWVFYSVFIVVVQLTSNGFVLCMFVHCKIMKFRHAKYDVILLFSHISHDSPG